MTETTLTITGADDQIRAKVGKFFKEAYLPTKEDLERVITQEEQKELCLKYKCRVDIWKWNPVDDCRSEYKASGRFQRWSDKLRMRMLVHSVNLKKVEVLYDENIIAKIRKTEWEMRKKDSILSLNLWKREREREVETHDEQQCREINDFSDPERANVIANTTDIACHDNNVFNYVNTESMTLYSLSQATTQQSVQPSQDVIPPDYEEFNNEIPSTSTQSQEEEMVDVDVVFDW